MRWKGRILILFPRLLLVSTSRLLPPPSLWDLVVLWLVCPRFRSSHTPSVFFIAMLGIVLQDSRII